MVFPFVARLRQLPFHNFLAEVPSDESGVVVVVVVATAPSGEAKVDVAAADCVYKHSFLRCKS